MQSQEVTYESRSVTEEPDGGYASGNRINPKITLRGQNDAWQRERSNVITVPGNWLSLIDIKPITFLDINASNSSLQFKEIFKESFNNYRSHPEFKDYEVIDPSLDPTIIYSELLSRLSNLAKDIGFKYSICHFSDDENSDSFDVAPFGVLIDNNYFKKDKFLGIELSKLEGIEYGDAKLYNVISYIFANMISKKGMLTWKDLAISDVEEEMEMNEDDWDRSDLKKMRECIDYYKNGAPARLLNHLLDPNTIGASSVIEKFSTSDKALNKFLDIGKKLLNNPLTLSDFNPDYNEFDDSVEGVNIYKNNFLSWSCKSPVEKYYCKNTFSLSSDIGVKYPQRIIEIERSGWNHRKQDGIDFFDHLYSLYTAFYKL